MASSNVSTLAPFRNRNYLFYWLTGLAANFGWLIQQVGASWLMTSLVGTADMVALVQTSLALPVMLLSLPAGAIADALGRRTLVIWSQAFLLIVSVTLAVFAYLGHLTPWLLLAFTFLIGCGKALNNPGWQTKVTELVPRDQLSSAISLNSVGFNIARSVGPAIGGAIVAAVGAFAAFAINAIGNFGVILVASRWPKPTAQRELPRERFVSAMLAGVRYVSMSPHLLLILARSAIFSFAAISVMALMPLIARDLIQGGPQTFGFLLGTFGLGAISGAFTGEYLRRTFSLEWVVRGSFTIFAIATAVMALSPYIVLTMLATALAGASWLVTQSTFNTTVQTSSPRWVLSRCHSIYQTVSFGFNALGGWVWGMVAAQSGISMALLLSAGCVAFGALVGVFLSLRKLETSGLDPHGQWTGPVIGVDMLPVSGPIMSTIKFRIKEKDVPEFLAIMLERRRNRARDGARAWTLSRDIEDHEVWYESFKTPTWIETQRLHQRRTIASARLSDRLRQLHQGEGRPKTRYELVRRPGRALSDTHALNRDLEH